MASIVVNGDTSGAVTLSAPATAGTVTVTLPAASGTMATLTTPSFATTIGVGGATASASGSGITFPATQSASSDANTLDDYEEGTYTMTWTCASGSITLGTNLANYTKIGRVVIVNANVVVSSVSSPSGTLNINLPFNSASSSGSARASPWIAFNGLGAGGNVSTAWPIINDSSSTCNVYVGGGATVSANFASYVTSSTDARVSMVYITS